MADIKLTLGLEPEIPVPAAAECSGEVPDPAEEKAATKTEPKEETENSGDRLLRDALRAAMNGGFRGYCRANGLYEGDAADRINGIFLEQIGDVVLEADADGGFRFVEEYRADAEEWLR